MPLNGIGRDLNLLVGWSAHAESSVLSVAMRVGISRGVINTVRRYPHTRRTPPQSPMSYWLDYFLNRSASQVYS
jgi:hypothetical protein